MNDAFIAELRQIFDSGFTGQVTIHLQDGTVKKCEKVEQWRPGSVTPRIVDLTEGGNRRQG